MYVCFHMRGAKRIHTITINVVLSIVYAVITICRGYVGMKRNGIRDQAFATSLIVMIGRTRVIVKRELRFEPTVCTQI